jgi:hypothetical protein
MNPITVLAVADAVLKYGPSVVGLLAKLHSDISAGRGERPVTGADWDELKRLADQSAEDIYKRLNIVPPAAPKP